MTTKGRKTATKRNKSTAKRHDHKDAKWPQRDIKLLQRDTKQQHRCKMTTKGCKKNTTKTHTTTTNGATTSFVVFLCLFQSGCPEQEGWGTFYMSLSRGPLSHNLSLAAGYLELQIEAIHWHSFISVQKFLKPPLRSRLREGSFIVEVWPVSQVIILTTVSWVLICSLSVWSPLRDMSWHEDAAEFESEVELANSLEMCCFPFSIILLPSQSSFAASLRRKKGITVIYF